MPGTTAYPAALDTFPDIGPNTKEDVVSHSGAHNNEAAAIAALQAKVGIDDSADPDSLDARVAAVESGKLDASAVGSTVAGLVGGKVPTAQLPSYVDDVIEVADIASLPATGETGKIYITLDDDAQYRWSGSAYVQLVASPGSTDAVPEGTTNLYFTDARAYAAVKAALQAGTHTGVSFAFDDGGHSISVTASGGGPSTTDALTEGSTNLYFTNERAMDAIAAMIAAGTHTRISFSYNDAGNALSATVSGVDGPGSSVAGNFAVFSDTSGESIDDGGTPGDMAFVDDAPNNGNEYVRKNGAWAVASATAGSSAWALVQRWRQSVDGNISGVVADVTGYQECRVIVRNVTLNSVDWRYAQISCDGGANYLGSFDISTNGVESSGTGIVLHTGSSSSARSGFATFPLLSMNGAIIPFVVPSRTIPAQIVVATGSITHVRVISGATTLTGGEVQIWCR